MRPHERSKECNDARIKRPQSRRSSGNPKDRRGVEEPARPRALSRFARSRHGSTVHGQPAEPARRRYVRLRRMRCGPVFLGLEIRVALRVAEFHPPPKNSTTFACSTTTALGCVARRSGANGATRTSDTSSTTARGRAVPVFASTHAPWTSAVNRPRERSSPQGDGVWVAVVAGVAPARTTCVMRMFVSSGLSDEI